MAPVRIGLGQRTRLVGQRLHVHRLQAQRAAPQAREHQQVVDQQRHAAGPHLLITSM